MLYISIKIRAACEMHLFRALRAPWCLLKLTAVTMTYSSFVAFISGVQAFGEIILDVFFLSRFLITLLCRELQARSRLWIVFHCPPHPLRSVGKRWRWRHMKKCFKGQLRPRLHPERSLRTNAALRQAALKCLSTWHFSPCSPNL